MAPSPAAAMVGVESGVGQPVLLQATDGVGDLRRRDVVALVAESAEVVVEARDLLDHAHDAGLVPVALEVPPDALVDALVGRGGRVRVQDDAVQRLAEALLHLGRHLAEDLFLRFEVVVEGPVREAGPLGDVGDPGVEEPVLLEDLLGRREEARPRLDALAGPGPARLVAREASASTWPAPSRRDPVTLASTYRRSRVKPADSVRGHDRVTRPSAAAAARRTACRRRR